MPLVSMRQLLDHAAENGYAVHDDIAFFPGLPLVMRLGMVVGAPPQVSGAAVALVCSAFATVAHRASSCTSVPAPT